MHQSHWNVRRVSRCIALASGVAIAGSVSAQVQVFENFDTNPAPRGWSGVDNRTAPQNYGWSGDDPLVTGTHTGGAPGEMGGTLTRANPISPIFFDEDGMGGLIPQPNHPNNFYGVELGGLFNLALNPFVVSGVVHVEQRNNSGGFLLGYSTGVDSYTDGVDRGDAKNFIGLNFDDGDNVGGIVWGGTGGRTLNQAAPNVVQGTTHNFNIVFDPDGFAGGGTMDIVIDGNGFTMGLGGAYEDVDLLDHFGIFPVSANGSPVIAWFDDLSYTSLTGTGPTLNKWIGASAGSYMDAANWANGAIPNAIDANGNFLGAISSSSTVVLDTAATVGSLRFSNTASYNIGGLGSLTLQVSSGSAMIEVINGVHKINVPLIVASDTTLNVTNAGTLKLSDPVTVNAGKSLTQVGTGSVKYESTISVGAGGSITFNSSSHPLSLTLASGARATLSASNPTGYILHTHSLTMPSDARVDLGDNTLALDYVGGSPIATIRSQVATAFAAGWNANGITSSSAAASLSGPHPLGIGVVEASTLGVTSFLGEQIDSTTVLARTTFNGDTNIDGTVDTGDFNRLALNFNQSGKFWFDGDFNYDGVVNALDFNSIATNFGQVQAGSLPLSALSGLVPEPGSLAALVVGAGIISSRRRRV